MRLAAAGDNCIDYYAAEGAARPGGNPVNVAVNLVAGGGQASYLGAVGSDDHGRLLIDALAGRGVDVSHVRVLPGKTAVTQVELVDGERRFGEYDEGVMADFRLREEDLDFIAGHDLFVTGLWGHLEDQLGLVRARGVPVAFDFATKPDDPVVAAAIGQVDYAFFATEGPDGDALRDRMRDYASRGPRVVVATMGAYGSVALADGVFIECPARPCPVIDTMGAGDSYIAGFLRGVLLAAPVEECMRLGAVSASRTLGINGAW
ncbi:fructoselysine 6-kinase [Actinoallomurus rhizosphaericola]|uniref:fructoselysine 6-kinase n=1 Tax=Actinoallomurus rhizosphaericola TaxID=2952536 RepID=UPI0020927D77|nr:fructoselysine 6-kinase [Actinoallomurus rhizosphaericola]MCO5997903.1 fructoselysine 6-kinase [Actinoallomurus rhizosphaericola]